MSRRRNKQYERGQRINIYLSRDVTDEFLEWINKQSDLSNFFLYAAKQLHEQTGNTDVSEIMPRKVNYNLSDDEITSTYEDPAEEEKEESINEIDNSIKDKEEPWSQLKDLDDPFA